MTSNSLVDSTFNIVSAVYVENCHFQFTGFLISVLLTSDQNFQNIFVTEREFIE